MAKPLDIPFVAHGVRFENQEAFMVRTRDYLMGFPQVNQPGAPLFAADSMILFGRTVGFLADARFTAAVRASDPDDTEATIIWRTHVLCWAASHGAALAGDFVECGTYRGYSASVIARYVDLTRTGKRFFLYDLFDPPGGPGEGHRMPDHGAALHEGVRRRFVDFPTVQVIKGRVPDSFAQALPDAIAFLHIDMNNAEAELAALEQLFDRVVPGALIVLDDYGYRRYLAQHEAEDRFAAARGYAIVELPTGQGLVIKR